MKIQKNVRRCKQILTILILGIVCMMSGRMQGGVVQAAWAGTVDDTYLTEGDSHIM